MIRARTLGLALAAVFAFSAVAAASAAAHEFKASKAPGELKGKQTAGAAGEQIFTTPAGKVKCTEDTVTGTIKELTTKKQIATVEYRNCTLFGFAEAKVSPAEYEFEAEPSATEGKVKVLKEITVKVKVIGGECEVKVPVQGPLGNVEYVNSAGKLEVRAKVTKIKSSGVGPEISGCKDYTNNETGEYIGNNLVEEVGGTIEYV
jgi:hypothetical protein